MPNERLRDALLRNGLGLDHVARATSVDPKTVERWITQARTPYPRHRHTIAAMVRETENYLWPDAVAPARKAEIGTSEIIKVYPHRHAVPAEVWEHLMSAASRHIEILVYAGMFLTDNPKLTQTLRAKAEAGANIRIALGDPNGREVAKRSTEEGIGKDTLAAKVRNTLAVFKPLADIPNLAIRSHNTTLYNSVYRFDDDMLVNTHVYGFMAAHAPVLHLRRLTGGDLFETYSESFDTVWNTAKPPKW
ncbi:XRE family transcriptional regulator [Actinokineospora pegani]|uniref:XRE family transcriptional regulator n=1 Tax=Actinokineospora pegani TaxID=2654637 RepID=UPI0012E9B2A2|nr:XRE family transcriptional regulator [Actinokineospora pegani]